MKYLFLIALLATECTTTNNQDKNKNNQNQHKNRTENNQNQHKNRTENNQNQHKNRTENNQNQHKNRTENNQNQHKNRTEVRHKGILISTIILDEDKKESKLELITNIEEIYNQIVIEARKTPELGENLIKTYGEKIDPNSLNINKNKKDFYIDPKAASYISIIFDRDRPIRGELDIVTCDKSCYDYLCHNKDKIISILSPKSQL